MQKCSFHLLTTRNYIFTIILLLFSSWSLLPIISTTWIIAVNQRRIKNYVVVDVCTPSKFTRFLYLQSPRASQSSLSRWLSIYLFVCRFLFARLCNRASRNINNNYERVRVLRRHWTAMSAVVKANRVHGFDWHFRTWTIQRMWFRIRNARACVMRVEHDRRTMLVFLVLLSARIIIYRIKKKRRKKNMDT